MQASAGRLIFQPISFCITGPDSRHLSAACANPAGELTSNRGVEADVESTVRRTPIHRREEKLKEYVFATYSFASVQTAEVRFMDAGKPEGHAMILVSFEISFSIRLAKHVPAVYLTFKNVIDQCIREETTIMEHGPSAEGLEYPFMAGNVNGNRKRHC